MKLAALTEYSEDDGPGKTVHIAPESVSAVRQWKYHSFRSPITEIVLNTGEKIRVWQDIETVVKRLKEADQE